MKPLFLKPMFVRATALLAPLSPVVLLMMLAPPAAARSEQVPKLPVESSCHSAETYGLTDAAQTYKNCMADENQAKAELEKSWSKYKIKTKHDCLAAGMVPSPSYVELLTCIEMTEEILKPPASAAGGGGGPISGGGAHGGSPPPMPALAPGPRAMPH